jgi:hypothetical protein
MAEAYKFDGFMLKMEGRLDYKVALNHWIDSF